ncbi:MAG TPA: hypothetical protein VHP36_09950 [Chitinispirillaceae bacterium]|nr:hypothetical protein [Chitinispirillaceae bacterium]
MHNSLSEGEPVSQKTVSSGKKFYITGCEETHNLSELCKMVTSCAYSYEDLAEKIEDKAYEECEQGKAQNALKKLIKITVFFEKLKFKNEEIARDLADVYLLIGQIHQYSGNLEESISWFSKAIVVDDRYSVPYHSCAVSNLKLGRNADAIRCLEQEIFLSPGNYYSYILLSDIYKDQQMQNMVENTLKRLLERDPNNIQGLHRLIRYYEQSDPTVEVQLLRRRLLGSKSQFNHVEMMIRCYHLCREKRYKDVLEFIDSWSAEVTIIYLIRAHVFAEMRQFTRKRLELAEFIKRNHGKEEIMMAKLQEFGLIFGKNAEKQLIHKLDFTFPDH